MANAGYLFLAAAILSSLYMLEAAGGKGYNLQIGNNQNFTVSINNTLILQHSLTSPMFFVGVGQLDFREFRGNFFINNYVGDKIPPFRFDVISNTNDSDQIRFSNGTSFAVNVMLKTTDQHPLVVTFDVEDKTLNDFWLRVVAQADEQVYGLGEQYSYLNLRGRTYPIWTREQGVGRNKSDIVTFMADTLAGGAGGDYHTTYFPQTTFVSSRKYYFHYGGSNYAEVNLAPPTFHEIYVNGPIKSFYFKTGVSIKGVVHALSNYLGQQPELPEWVYTGAILGIQGGTDLMLQRYQQAKQNGVPVSGLWIQDWAGVLKTSFGSRLFWDWKWNQTLYPRLDNVTRQLKLEGVRVLGYINPNLNMNGDLFKEGAKNKYFVKNSTDDPYLTDFGEFFCGTVDFTNPDAKNWYKGVIQKNMIDLGLSGWMADFGEYLPADGVYFYNSTSGREIHNKWPTLWAEVNRMAIDERKVTGDVVFWMRAGSAGTGNYTTLMWAGDQNVDFSYGDGLPSTIPAALNLGMSGIGITHFDIGGYTTAAQFKAAGKALVRTEELLLRSAEAAIFTPMFRSHEGNQPGANVQFYTSNYTEQCFGRLAQIFVHISNYTKQYVRENSLFGTPVQRPLFIEFPDDDISRTVTYQYMYGSDLLVAPVIQPGVSSMKVYLPPGEWRFIWDSNRYDGHQFVTVSAPLGQPPAFYKSSSTWSPMFSEILTKFPLIIPPTQPPTANPTTPTPTPCHVTGSGNRVSAGDILINICVFAAMYLSLKTSPLLAS